MLLKLNNGPKVVKIYATLKEGGLKRCQGFTTYLTAKMMAMQQQDDIITELLVWQKHMLKKPSLLNRLSKKLQTKINNWIPEKVHKAITATIKQMIRAVLFSAKYTTAKALPSGLPLADKEEAVRKKIEFYRTTAAVEGGITGAGGILLGLADFPILLTLKLKLLFDIAAIYGFNVKDYKERVYILHLFELAFSSHEHRRHIYLKIVDWDAKSATLPDDINQFDWRNFQQEYRDYIDLAKLAQLIPVIGAPVGAVVNYGLIKKLGITAMNGYRMRLLKQIQSPVNIIKPLQDGNGFTNRNRGF